MTILVPVLAVACAAFCVWLTVRIVNRQERWAKWTAVAIILLAIAGYAAAGLIGDLLYWILAGVYGITC